MGELRAFKPGMDRNAEQKEVDTFIMSSLADFIEAHGRRPEAAIVIWIDDDGDQVVSWANIDSRDLALASLNLGQEAIGE